MTNPFTPTFGVIPAHMAGREHIISELIRALEAGPGDPGLTTILTALAARERPHSSRIWPMRPPPGAGSRPTCRRSPACSTRLFSKHSNTPLIS